MKLETRSKFEYIFIIVMLLAIGISIYKFCQTLEYELVFFVSIIVLAHYLYSHLKFNDLRELEEKEIRNKAQSLTSVIMSGLICVVLGFSYVFKSSLIIETWVLVGLILMAAELILLSLYIINGIKY